mmetsp:Transcript_6857/g.13957  ORF Transcript_6857/g.13957 Transcript_6857/m.13957 type:complete len:97 (+) Transcript_6857:91-381(+)
MRQQQTLLELMARTHSRNHPHQQWWITFGPTLPTHYNIKPWALDSCAFLVNVAGLSLMRFVVLIAMVPCQSFSAARAGLAVDTSQHLRSKGVLCSV